MQIAEIEIQVRYVRKYLKSRLDVGNGFRVVISSRHSVAYPCSCGSVRVHGKGLDITFERSDEVNHFRFQNASVHEVKGFVVAGIFVFRVLGVRGADSLVEPFKSAVELSVLQLLKSFYKIAFGSRSDDQFVAARQDMVAYHSA